MSRVYFQATLKASGDATFDRDQIERVLEENGMYEEVNGYALNDGLTMMVTGYRALGGGPAANLSGAVASVVTDVEIAAGGSYGDFAAVKIEASVVE